MFGDVNLNFTSSDLSCLISLTGHGHDDGAATGFDVEFLMGKITLG